MNITEALCIVLSLLSIFVIVPLLFSSLRDDVLSLSYFSFRSFLSFVVSLFNFCDTFFLSFFVQFSFPPLYQIVKDFADRLQESFARHGVLYGATVMHGGSAYESLCVKKDTDFDITIVLGEPYVAKNFEVDQRRRSYRIDR